MNWIMDKKPPSYVPIKIVIKTKRPIWHQGYGNKTLGTPAIIEIEKQEEFIGYMDKIGTIKKGDPREIRFEIVGPIIQLIKWSFIDLTSEECMSFAEKVEWRKELNGE